MGSEKAVVERALLAKPGVASVECNPVSQTTTVRYEPERISVTGLQACVQACGYDCAGESLPSYMGKAGEASSQIDLHTAHVAAVRAGPADHGAMVMAPDEAMGHGGHAGMSMSIMVRDMRNRFLVALALSIPITLWCGLQRRASPRKRRCLHPAGAWFIAAASTTVT